VSDSRRLMIHADYECWPTWWVDTTGGMDNPDPRDLGLSPELARDLVRWSDDLDATYDPAYPPDSRFETPAQEAAFWERGPELARRTADELRGRAEVFYRTPGGADTAL